MNTPLVLVTGANGFIGRSLCSELVQRGWSVRGATRSRTHETIEGCEWATISNLDANTDWADALQGVGVVVHLAARAHLLSDPAVDPLEEFRRVNVVGTERLARAAVASGVKRLVYVSSIGVNGQRTISGKAFSEEDEPHPHNAYAVSKWEAEQCLMRISAETGMEVVIVRPPLVYGGGAPGNFELLLKALRKRLPLPLANVRNLRSLIYVENLVDSLITCAHHPAAAGQTYLVRDGEDISTSGLLRELGQSIARPVILFYFPLSLLRIAGSLVGKTRQIDGLLGSLQICDDKIRRELAWQPPYSMREGLRRTGAEIERAIDNWSGDERRQSD